MGMLRKQLPYKTYLCNRSTYCENSTDLLNISADNKVICNEANFKQINIVVGNMF